MPNTKQNWWRVYMIGLHAAVLASIFLAHLRVTGGYGVYGHWVRHAMLALTGLLCVSSVASLFKNRPLALSGFLLAGVVVFLVAVTKEKMP